MNEYPFAVDHYATNKELGLHRLALIQWLIENGVKASTAKQVHWMGWKGPTTLCIFGLRNERGLPFLNEWGVIARSWPPLEIEGRPPLVGTNEGAALRYRYWVEQLGGKVSP